MLRKNRVTRALHICVALGIFMPSNGNALELKAGNAAGTPYIIATGEIEVGDAKRFKSFAKDNGIKAGVVAISSPGGAINEALDIGRYLRRNEFTTMVPATGRCFSSCFLLFAGGVERSIGANAEIGSHQFYWAEGDVPNGLKATAITQSITADIIEYLLQTRIDLQALTFIMRAPPDSMFVFSPYLIERFNIIGNDSTADARSRAGDIVVPDGIKKPGCPWPDRFIASDPMNINPECKT